MSSTAQILANRQNADLSTGPATAEGKATVSRNATRFGLFSVANFVRPGEENIFDEFQSGYLAELAPDSPLEQTLAREIVQSAWRLRRCANLEATPPEDLTDEELDRLQISIDRARSAAQRTFHRSLKELRRLQAERLYATFALKQARKYRSAKFCKTNPIRAGNNRSYPAQRSLPMQIRTEIQTLLRQKRASCARRAVGRRQAKLKFRKTLLAFAGDIAPTCVAASFRIKTLIEFSSE